MEIPDPINVPVFLAMFDRHHFERLCSLPFARERPPLPIRRAFAKDSSFRFYVEIVVEAADFLNAVSICDPNIPINSTIRMGRHIQSLPQLLLRYL